jgi:glycosyltransferase involved in cell wall biosynthesis/Flp pilus assembly protein TadD/GT2 family glycosyltransferase
MCVLTSCADLFAKGDYASVALRGDESAWQTYAALGILGKPEAALEGLRAFDTPEARFYAGVACWINGEDERAGALLSDLADPHAQNLLNLIRKPKIHVLAQLPPHRQPPWDLLSGATHDTKFEIHNISFHPRDLLIEPYADIHHFYDARVPPDFYACLMAEWHLIPPNIQTLPCPLLGATADYDLFAQPIAPWLHVFDEMVVESQSQWQEMSQILRTPVSSFCKLNGFGWNLPPIPRGPRETDLFFSGTGLHPFLPEKARLLYQTFAMSDVKFRINNGFTSQADYYKYLGDTKVCFTYVRYPGTVQARGLESLAMGAAIIVPSGCLMTLYVGEEEGVLTHDMAEDIAPKIRYVLDNWDRFERRAQRGAEIIRREFAISRVASQYLRFLTFLAARPRGPRHMQPVEGLDQRQFTVWRGWTPPTPEAREARLARNLQAWHARLPSDPTPRTYIAIARELVLEYAPKARQNDTTPPEVQQLLQGALDTYRTGLERFPNALVLRFNFIRVCLHYGGPQDIQAARQLLIETLQQADKYGPVDILEDVFPWEFLPEHFHTRAYLDHVTRCLTEGVAASPTLTRLILASLHYYASKILPDSMPHLEEAVRLDPEFPFFALHLALALLERKQEGDTLRAGDILTRLALGSTVWTEACALLRKLDSDGLYTSPMREKLERAAANARQNTHDVDAAWNVHDNVLEQRLTSVQATVSEATRPAVITRSRKPGSPTPDILVSALVPVYNAERFLRGHLEDLEAQTIADRIEIIICDTGSPQNERAIAAEFMARYENILYIRTEHRENPHAAFNRCIAEATGKYLTTANADDRHRPDAFEIMARTLDEHPEVGLVYADVLITRFPNETFASNHADRAFRWPEFSLRQLLLYNFCGPQPMWRRSLHAECGVFDPSYLIAGDYDLFLRLAWKHGALHIPDVLGLYAEGGNESRNRERTVHETRKVQSHYRTQIPLEDIYPALRQCPRDPLARAAALLDLGNGCIASSSPDNAQAVTFYQQARALVGEDAVVLNNLGVALCLAGDIPAGVRILEPLAANGHTAAAQNLSAVRNPTGDANRFALGSLLHPILQSLPPLKPPAELQQPWHGTSRVARADDAAARERNAEGEQQFHRGDLNGAAQAFREAIRLSPHFALAHSNLGTVYWTQGDLVRAARSFAQALTHDPRDADALANSRSALESLQGSDAAQQAGPLQTAIAELREALVLAGHAQKERPKGLSFVIITAGQRPELLEVVMQSIRAQGIPNYEILVVGCHCDAPGLHYIPAEQAARGHRLGEMRNRGMDAARYDTIVLLDDDCLLARDWYTAFLAGPQDFDILTMQVRVPDGTRYWDHVRTGTANGDQQMLLDEEADPQVYATGGATILRAAVAAAIRWDDAMILGEDVDYSRRCQAHGYTITHNPRCLVYHADPTYTSIGRWCFRRTGGRTAQWVEAALQDWQPRDIYIQANALLNQDRTAEGVDCLRYGMLRYPDYAPFQEALMEIERMSGGHIPDTTWHLDGDPAFLTTLQEYQQAVSCEAPTPNPSPVLGGGGTLGSGSAIREDGHVGALLAAPSDIDRAQMSVGAQFIAPRSSIVPRVQQAEPLLNQYAGPRTVRICPHTERQSLTQQARGLNLPALRSSAGDYADEALPFLFALEAVSGKLSVQLARCGEQVAPLPVAAEARLQTLMRQQSQPGGVHISYLFPPCFRHREEARFHIGRALFEGETIPAAWAEACLRMDRIWVPSEFCRQAFLRAGVPEDRLAVVPGAILMPPDDVEIQPLPIDGARAFNFLSHLDWTRRKGWDVLVRAFVQEFTQGEDVALILKPQVGSNYTTAQITGMVVECMRQALGPNIAKAPNIVFHEAPIPPARLASFYRSADCFVLPSRAEGWGQTYLEAMALGLPVIGTNWGGNTDFMTLQNSYLINARAVPVPETALKETPTLRGQRWAEPDVAHLRRLLRQVYTEREAARALGQRARADVAMQCGYERVAAVIREELKRLGLDPTDLESLPLSTDILLR